MPRITSLSGRAGESQGAMWWNAKKVPLRRGRDACEPLVWIMGRPPSKRRNVLQNGLDYSKTSVSGKRNRKVQDCVRMEAGERNPATEYDVGS